MLCQEFAILYGEPPRVRDWSPATARAQGREDLAIRCEQDGCWPSPGIVQKLCGSWNQMLLDAGFPARPRGWMGHAEAAA